jgi:hypothetical protein
LITDHDGGPFLHHGAGPTVGSHRVRCWRIGVLSREERRSSHPDKHEGADAFPDVRPDVDFPGFDPHHRHAPSRAGYDTSHVVQYTSEQLTEAVADIEKVTYSADRSTQRPRP